MHSLHFYKNSLLLVGGQKAETTNSYEHSMLRVVSKYDLETKKWTPKIKKLPSPICSAGSVLINNDLWIVGGLTPAGFNDCVYRVDLEAMHNRQVRIELIVEE